MDVQITNGKRHASGRYAVSLEKVPAEVWVWSSDTRYLRTRGLAYIQAYPTRALATKAAQRLNASPTLPGQYASVHPSV